MSLTIINQMFLMGMFMSVGIFLFKLHYLDDEGVTQLTNILFKVCIPAIMVNSFNLPFSSSVLRNFVITFLLTCIVVFVSIAVSMIIFKPNQRIERFSAMFSNAGFIGIPLVRAVLGEGSVFYVTAFLLAFNLVVWTFGLYQVSGDKKLISIKSSLTSPTFIGLYLGLIVFFAPFKLPTFMSSAIFEIANINTPLAMIVLGYYSAKTPLKGMLEPRVFWVSFVRLIIVPAACALSLIVISNVYLEMKQAILIAVSAPAGVVTAMFAQQYWNEHEFGTSIVCQSTILSIVSIPVIMTISNLIWL